MKVINWAKLKPIALITSALDRDEAIARIQKYVLCMDAQNNPKSTLVCIDDIQHAFKSCGYRLGEDLEHKLERLRIVATSNLD